MGKNVDNKKLSKYSNMKKYIESKELLKSLLGKIENGVMMVYYDGKWQNDIDVRKEINPEQHLKLNYPAKFIPQSKDLKNL